jgi:N-methylhydantoinase B
MNMRIDDNLDLAADGTVACRHCSAVTGTASDPLSDALVREGTPRDAGPSVRADAGHFADREVLLRQVFCPGCLVLLQAEIVPADEPSRRTRSLAVAATEARQ